MKKWMCYFMNSFGHRDGTEIIHAHSKDEALELYKRFFNVSKYEDCRVIPVIGKGDCQ